MKLVWSITSGKRSVVLDGQEVHFSQGKPLRESKFCFQFNEWGHSFYLIAHVAPPIQKTPDFKMNELLIDGRSFHMFPKIYQLGQGGASKVGVLHRNATRSLTQPSATLHFANPPQYDYRNDYNRDSIQASTSSVRQESSPRTTKSSKSFQVQEQDLLGETKTAVVGTVSQGLDLLDIQNDTFASSSSALTTMVTTYDEFSPKNPTYHDISTSILQSYTPQNTTAVEPSTYSTASQPVPYHSSSTPAPYYEEHLSYVTPTQQPYSNYSIQEVERSMYKLHVDTSTLSSLDNHDDDDDDNTGKNIADSLPSPTGVSDLDHALKKICNLDDISQPVLTPYKQQTQRELQPQNMNLPLSQLKSTSSGGHKKEVMRNQHMYQSSQGQHLVVYGQNPSHLQQPISGQSLNRFALNYSY